MMSKTNIDALLRDIQPPRRPNIVGDNKPLAEAIEAFLDLKAANDKRVTGITLKWFYVEKLQGPMDGPTYFGTIRKYVRNVLGRDYLTGKTL